MRLAVVGTGYVGLVSGACFAHLGHDVTCIDANPAIIETLRSGGTTIYEHGLAELIAGTVAAGRLHFVSSMEEGLRAAEIVLIAVGTPPRPENGQADLTYVFEAARQIALHAPAGALIVTKSTVPIGTNRQIGEILKETRDDLAVASNPEFLREGSAIEDFLYPERIVVGIDAAETEMVLRVLYRPLLDQAVAFIASDLETAEMTKYAANSFLAAKVAFINEMADICENVGADILSVAKAMGMDSRIGPKFLNPGPGFGGSCFPKDTLALIKICNAKDIASPITDAVVSSNLARRFKMFDKIERAFGDVSGKKIAILGITFKPDTDDVRESPALAILPLLFDAGAALRVYDPEGMTQGKREMPYGIRWCANVTEALKGADGAVIITEWQEFKSFGLAAMKELLAAPLIVDLRNLFPLSEAQQAGVTYHSIGRMTIWPRQDETSG